MRQVAYTKKQLAHNRGRSMSICENVADEDSKTSIVKNFIYLVTRVDSIPQDLPDPEIRILKKVDMKARTEEFLFKVKGTAYIKKNRFIFQVRYCHGLKISILWKTHVLSSEKPAVLA